MMNLVKFKMAACSNLTLIIDLILIITRLIIKYHIMSIIVHIVLRYWGVNKYKRRHGTTIGDENGSENLGN